MRLVYTVITAVVPGAFDHVLKELVFCICLLMGAALRKKCLPTQSVFRFVISTTLTIFKSPQMMSPRV